MKRVKNVVGVFFFIVLVDYLFFKMIFIANETKMFDILYFVILSCLIFILFISFTYKWLFDFNSSKIKILLILILTFSFSMFISNRLLVINKFYIYSKHSNKKVSGNLWKYDARLGHKGVKNAIGTYDYYIGDSIKGSILTQFDSSGFRTVEKSKKLKYNTLDLYLGCSFTFGDYILAEEGYPYKTSKLLHHNYINAGASAYGIAQMKQLLDTLLVNYTFDNVFIQLSPWLTNRAMNLNGPTFYGYRPFPYYSENDSGFKLNYPIYKTLMYDKKNWKGTPISYKEKIYFLFSDGFKIEILDYLSFSLAKLQVFLGIFDEPTTDKENLEKYIYSYMINECLENNVSPTILKLKYSNNEANELLYFLRNKYKNDFKYIDLDKPLEIIVNSNLKLYDSLFTIYHETLNGEKIYFDDHPNQLANEIFSKEIYLEIDKQIK